MKENKSNRYLQVSIVLEFKLLTFVTRLHSPLGGPRLHWTASRVSSSCSHILAGPSINTAGLSQLGVRSTSFAYLMLQGQPSPGLSFLVRKIQGAGNGSFQAVPRNWCRPLSFESFCTVPGLSQMCKCGLMSVALQRNVWESRGGCAWAVCGKGHLPLQAPCAVSGN